MQIKNTSFHRTSQTNVSVSPWLSIVGLPVACRDEAFIIESLFSAENKDSLSFTSRQTLRKKKKVDQFNGCRCLIKPQSHLELTSHRAFETMSAGSFVTGIEAKRPCGTWLCQVVGPLGIILIRPARCSIQYSTPMRASSFT